MEEYWCHICKRAVAVHPSEVLCSMCDSPFVEYIEEDSHPQYFVPYQSAPSLNQMLSEILLSSSIRSIRYSETSDDNIEEIIHQLMQNDPNTYGPPPASQQAIDCLSSVKITQEVLRERGKLARGVDECGGRISEDRTLLECCVCREELIEGDHALDMPCAHLFHSECLRPWLTIHNNCPICRFELASENVSC